ncbi:CvfB family protein [Bacillus taeanensis]|uniref:S1 motif domain-containing protein n=1 Tax=Bacillus taeanensis TaxID=273032 RepID=A0A366XZK9_9BACI|nr:S1-like domain-containing RNA-binding protein [Bacillus taeanensis]RBW71367.1 hypothetical protein DS031_01045 [Bacillus taeanensis]
MKLQAGTVVSLTVDREAEFGYFLTNGTEDVLLHKSEIERPLAEEETIEVFLYQDHQGRLAATMTIPTISLDIYKWVQVVSKKRKLGVFVDIGIKKDMLVSLDELPKVYGLWPEEGDWLYCTLILDKKGRLFAKLAGHEQIIEISRDAEEEMFNKDITGTVYEAMGEGSFFISEDGIMGFVHKSEWDQEPRLGGKIQGRIIEVKEDRSVNVSLLPRKQERLGDDAERIYAFIEENGGKIPYWDKTEPEAIKETFHMSKAAFKRAMGRLMKEGKVSQKDGATYIKES